MNYINISSGWNEIFVTESDDKGRLFRKTVKNFHPEVFVTDPNGEWKDLVSKYPLRKIDFKNVSDYREYVKNMKNVDGLDLFNVFDPSIQYIRKYYSSQTSIIFPNIWLFDIETDLYEDRFADPIDAMAPITLMQVYDRKNKDYLIFSFNREYEPSESDVKYFNCDSEVEMISKWVEMMYERDVAVITAHFGDQFDFPYLVNRMKRIGMDPNILSPFDKLENHNSVIFGKKTTIEKPVGIYWVDSKEAYQKVTFGGRESWSLDFLAKYEGIEGKLDYTQEGFRSMADFIRGKYDPDVDKVRGKLFALYSEGKESTPEFRKTVSDLFVDYGIEDVRILKELDENLSIFDILFGLQWKMKSNLYDVFGTVAPWLNLIYNSLYDRKIAIQSKKTYSDRSYGGGYVYAKKGKVDWAMTEDATSLYPSIKRLFNTSPETYVPYDEIPSELKIFYDKLCNNPKADEMFLSFSHEQKQKLKTSLQKHNLTMSVNGTFYRKDEIGIIPYLVTGFFDGRQKSKKEMKEADIAISKTDDTQEISELKHIVKIKNISQLVDKTLINAAYGFLGCEFNPLYNPDIAEAITSYGRYQIRDIGQYVCDEINSKFKTSLNICLNDTDSFFIDMTDLVDKFKQKGDYDDYQIAEMLDKFDKSVIQGIIQKRANEHFEFLNGYSNVLKFDREKIGTVIITGKKHYAFSVIDEEGKIYNPRDIKVTGIEIKRSSTPAIVRTKLEDALTLIFEKDNEATVDFINEFREEYTNKQYSIDQIAIPTGVSDIEKYINITKGIPIHVRACKNHNNLIEEKGYEFGKINSGDKIKWVRLKVPNPVGDNVVAFNDSRLITENGLIDYIDYKEMFEKTFMKPLSSIINAIGWRMDIESAMMDELF